MPPRPGGHTIADVTDWYLGSASDELSEPVARAADEEPAPRPRTAMPAIEAVFSAHLGLQRQAAVEAYLRAGSAGRANAPVLLCDGREIECGYLELFAPAKDGDSGDGAATVRPRATFLTDPDEADQLATYKAIKRHQAALAGWAIGVFVVNSADENEGHATGRRMSQFVQRFLGIPVEYAGCAIRRPSGEDTAVPSNLTPSGADSDNSCALAKCEIEDAVPVEAPLDSLGRLEAFVRSYVSAFCPQAVRCERMDGPEYLTSAILLRAVSARGADSLIVAAAGAAPGILEFFLGRHDEIGGIWEIVWVGHEPAYEQAVAARRLGVDLRHVALRHIRIDGHLGVLLQS